MNGTTAQIVALACHFNGRAAGNTNAGSFSANSTCKFCEFVAFGECRASLDGHTEWFLVAPNPDECLSQKAQACARALLSYEPAKGLRQDRQLAGLIGHGGTWKLLLENGSIREAWKADWEVGQQQDPAQRIWRVRYTLSGEPTERPSDDPRPLDSVISDLQQALVRIIEFCSDHRLDSSIFRKSIECLRATHPLRLAYHADLCPEGLLSLPALQLMAASQVAWVFGAMGS